MNSNPLDGHEDQPRTRIPDGEIVAVREASPIADVVREHGVELLDAGDGNLKGRCLFHAETQPSFNVTPARGYWYCFGCAEGGDVITFVRKARGIDYSQAVAYLAARAGITLQPEPVPRPPRQLTCEAYEATAHLVDERLVLTFRCGQDDTITIGLPPAVARLFVVALSGLTGPEGGGDQPSTDGA